MDQILDYVPNLEIRTNIAYSVDIYTWYKKDTGMAKARHSRFDCSPGCAVEAAISLIDGKWKSVVLFHLMGGTLRFNELRRQIPSVTQRMLTNQLRELEEDGLIERKGESALPPPGPSIEPILLALKKWGDANIDRFGRPVKESASSVQEAA